MVCANQTITRLHAVAYFDLFLLCVHVRRLFDNLVTPSCFRIFWKSV